MVSKTSADYVELHQALLILDLAARLLNDAEAVSRECATLIALHRRSLSHPGPLRLDPTALALFHAGAVRIQTALDGDQAA